MSHRIAYQLIAVGTEPLSGYGTASVASKQVFLSWDRAEAHEAEFVR